MDPSSPSPLPSRLAQNTEQSPPCLQRVLLLMRIQQHVRIHPKLPNCAFIPVRALSPDTVPCWGGAFGLHREPCCCCRSTAGLQCCFISAPQQAWSGDACTHTHPYIHLQPLQILSPYRSLQDTEHSSLCYMVGFFNLFYTVVCLCYSQIPHFSLPTPYGAKWLLKIVLYFSLKTLPSFSLQTLRRLPAAMWVKPFKAVWWLHSSNINLPRSWELPTPSHLRPRSPPSSCLGCSSQPFACRPLLSIHLPASMSPSHQGLSILQILPEQSLCHLCTESNAGHSRVLVWLTVSNCFQPTGCCDEWQCHSEWALNTHRWVHAFKVCPLSFKDEQSLQAVSLWPNDFMKRC